MLHNLIEYDSPLFMQTKKIAYVPHIRQTFGFCPSSSNTLKLGLLRGGVKDIDIGL